MTGEKDRSEVGRTRGVRNCEASSPRRGSAKSLIRFRKSTNVKPPNKRETRMVRETKVTVSPLVFGWIKRRSEEESENKTANSSRLGTARIMMSFLRLIPPPGF